MNILKINIDIPTISSQVVLGDISANAFDVIIKLPNISETNYQYIATAVQRDWSSAMPGELYFIDITGTTIKAPPKSSDNYTWDWVTNSWKDQRDITIITEEVRLKRNELLKASDWTQMPDVILTNKASWATYRQELRDVMSQEDMYNVVWPTPPQG